MQNKRQKSEIFGKKNPEKNWLKKGTLEIFWTQFGFLY